MSKTKRYLLNGAMILAWAVALMFLPPWALSAALLGVLTANVITYLLLSKRVKNLFYSYQSGKFEEFRDVEVVTA
jgi:hypothetical protein